MFVPLVIDINKRFAFISLFASVSSIFVSKVLRFFATIILLRIFFFSFGFATCIQWIHGNCVFKHKFEITTITVCKIYNKSCNVDMSINLFIRNLTLIGQFWWKKKQNKAIQNKSTSIFSLIYLMKIISR